MRRVDDDRRGDFSKSLEEVVGDGANRGMNEGARHVSAGWSYRMTGAVTLRLQESPVLWVIEAAYDRTAWWRKRLDLGWLDVRRLDGGQEVETFEFPVPQSLAIDVGVDNEPAGLQLMARWNARQFPTLVIATLDPAASSAATWLRSAGAIDLIVGWGDVARSQRLIERFWKVHRPAVSDPYDMVARRLPGRFR